MGDDEFEGEAPVDDHGGAVEQETAINDSRASSSTGEGTRLAAQVGDIPVLHPPQDEDAVMEDAPEDLEPATESKSKKGKGKARSVSPSKSPRKDGKASDGGEPGTDLELFAWHPDTKAFLPINELWNEIKDVMKAQYEDTRLLHASNTTYLYRKYVADPSARIYGIDTELFACPADASNPRASGAAPTQLPTRPLVNCAATSTTALVSW